MSKQQWEYAEVRHNDRGQWELVHAGASEDLPVPKPWVVQVLNAAGENGWELVGAYESGGEDGAGRKPHLLLKRPKS